MNARKSTGPKSPKGKARVRLNALTHGLTAATVVLPGEDAAALDERLAAWKADLRTGGPVEDYFAEQAVNASWQLDRANRTIAARLTDRMLAPPPDPDLVEADEVDSLTRDLFRDPRGPAALYPHTRYYSGLPRISAPEGPDGPLPPAAIIRRLEALPTGCRWLLDRWAELRTILHDGRQWQPLDRFRAVRLLGGQPLDALEDDRLLAIYMACDAMDPKGPPALDDLLSEMTLEEEPIFIRRERGRGVEARTPASPAAGKAVLLATIEEAMNRLEVRLAAHRERRAAERPRPRPLDLLAFDDSPEGELMRRYQQSRERALHRSIGTLFRVRKEDERAGEPIDEPAGDDGLAGIEIPSAAEPMAVAVPVVVGDETKPIAVAVIADDETKPIDVPAIAGDETKPIGVPAGAGDETKPIAVAIGAGDETKPIGVPAGAGDEPRPMAAMAVEDAPAIDAPDSPPPADVGPVAGTGSSGRRRPARAPRRPDVDPDGDPVSEAIEAGAAWIVAEAFPAPPAGLDDPLPTGEAAQLAHLADLEGHIDAAVGLGPGAPDLHEEMRRLIRRYEALYPDHPAPRKPPKPRRVRARP